MKRKTFIRLMGAAGAGMFLAPKLVACSTRSKKIPLKIIGASAERGHILRSMGELLQRKIDEVHHVNHIVVGGGVSGLSTVFHLEKIGVSNIVLLELEDKVSGNAGSSQLQSYPFPLGAHYLSLPNPKNTELAEFLAEEGLIVGTQDGKWIFNERHLCHSPDERLWYKGTYQEGLVPEYGMDAKNQHIIAQFFTDMEMWKKKLTSTGDDMFAIPSRLPVSKDDLRWSMDRITFLEWLDQNDYSNTELRWFLDYCCRDDFGAGLEKVSAWAGVHYFAGRKAEPANAKSSAVMTWPEGNNFLVKRIEKRLKTRPNTGHLVLRVSERENEVSVLTYDCVTNRMKEFIAPSVTLACQSFVAARLLHNQQFEALTQKLQHYPWMVSAVVLTELPNSGSGSPLSWDNVKYGEKQLGYINNRHQELDQSKLSPFVLSVYTTFDELNEQEARQKLFRLTEDELRNCVVDELKKFHPDCAEYIQEIHVQRWGHGMITPVCGTLRTLNEIQSFTQQQFKKIQFAHTDYVGYSIFEEAFEQGRKAALSFNHKKDA